MVNVRNKSTPKPIGAVSSDSNDARKWWFVLEKDQIFAQKKNGRAKVEKKELGAVESIAPSKTKPDVLKVIIVSHIETPTFPPACKDL